MRQSPEGYARRELKHELQRDVEMVRLILDVNGERSPLLVPVHKTLLEVLREDMGLTGTKHGCELGECGTCTVLVDGKPQLSCLLLPIQIEGRAITTIEGMARGSELHPLQQTFAELGAAQCGYCTPGILLASRSLLESNPKPTRDEIREALAGNLCRCTGYTKILDAVELAALRMTSGTGAGRSASRGASGAEVSGEMTEVRARVPAP
jgi:aerobic-type carbon monoxide dehydrogenase small subunit (CoxS/CutS family)